VVFDWGFAKFQDFVSKGGKKIEQLGRLIGVEGGKSESFLAQTQQAKNSPGVFDVSLRNSGSYPISACAGAASQQGHTIGPGFERFEKQRLGDSAAARYSYHPYFARYRSQRVLKGLERDMRVPVTHKEYYFEIVFHDPYPAGDLPQEPRATTSSMICSSRNLSRYGLSAASDGQIEIQLPQPLQSASSTTA
jgi:hypothetical protein